MEFEVVAGGGPQKKCGDEDRKSHHTDSQERCTEERAFWLRSGAFSRTFRRHGRDCCLIAANGQTGSHGTARSDFDNKFIALKYFSGTGAVEFDYRVEQSPRGLRGLQAICLRAFFVGWVFRVVGEHKVPRLVLTALRLGAALGMTECLRCFLSGANYDAGTSSELRCWRSSLRNCSWFSDSARFRRPSNRSSGSSDV